LNCELSGSSVVVYNSTPSNIEKGQKLGSEDSTGEQGISVVQQPFRPGDRMRLASVSRGSSCSAWATPLPVQLELAPD
jgi:hypothetical protein